MTDNEGSYVREAPKRTLVRRDLEATDKSIAPICHSDASLALARSLCVVALLFASGDVWPVIRIGFTFRLSQVCVLAAALVVLFNGNQTLRPFSGFKWAYAYLLWITLTLPFSLLLARSIGYVVWAVTDFLIIAILVQCFDDERSFRTLMIWFTNSFSVISLFGIAQLILGVIGHPIFVTEWWIKGILPRVNGLSYEPSYYATYLIAGWVFAQRLLERNGQFPPRILQKICLWSTTSALIICGSRMGWLMMILWMVFRSCRKFTTSLVRGRMRRGVLQRLPVVVVGLCVAFGGVLHYRVFLRDQWVKVDFLLRGLDLVDHSSASSGPRIKQLRWTLDSIAEHPIVGSGIGALPVEIAPHEDSAVWTLKEAKQHEGMSIFPEVVASTGIVGALLMVGFALSVFLRCQKALMVASASGKAILSALSWGLIWMLLMLQMNQNFLRIYMFVDLAALLCCCEVIIRPSRTAGRRDVSSLNSCERVRGPIVTMEK